MDTIRPLLGLLILPAVLAYVSYDGYKVFQIQPSTKEEYLYLKEVAKDSARYDIWRSARAPGDSMDVMVHPESIDSFQEALQSHSLEYRVMMEDVGVTIAQQMEEITQRKADHLQERDYDYFNYHDLAEIEAWIDEFQANYSSLVTVFTVGQTYEGRTIRGFKISTGPGEGGVDKPATYIDNNIHAREWICVATTQYMMARFLTAYNNGDVAVVPLLDSIDIYYVPIFNPDGYAYTWTDDRLWGKTRSANNGSSCFGTDPNLNWDFFHCERGGLPDPCSVYHCGPGPWSEIETRGHRDLMMSIPNLQLFLGFHSYGQWYMLPWAHYTDPPADHSETLAFCQRGVDALVATHGANFTCVTTSSAFGEVSGSNVDWAYDVLGVRYSIAPELRDQGENGFVLPPDQIQPSGEENYNAFIELLTALKEEFAP